MHSSPVWQDQSYGIRHKMIHIGAGILGAKQVATTIVFHKFLKLYNNLVFKFNQKKSRKIKIMSNFFLTNKIYRL
jgi:hypothetical protein